MDVQEVIDVEMGNHHSQLVAMMIFDRNNTPKKGGSIYSYYKPKTKRSWFYFKYYVPEEKTRTQLSSEEESEYQSTKKSTKKIKPSSKVLSINTTLESILKNKNISPSNKEEDSPGVTTPVQKSEPNKIFQLKVHSGINPPPTSTSPTRKRGKTFNIDAVSNSIMEEEGIADRSLVADKSMTHLKMGKSLGGVLNSTLGSKLQEQVASKTTKKSTKKLVDPKVMVTGPKFISLSNMEDQDNERERKTAEMESFHIPLEMGLNTSFEMIIPSENKKPKTPQMKDKTKKPIKSTKVAQKPFLGFASLRKKDGA